MSTIASPCILVCAIEPESGFCFGCGRSRAEIAGWTRLDDDERARLMRDELPGRVAGLERRPRRVTRRRRLRQTPRVTRFEGVTVSDDQGDGSS